MTVRAYDGGWTTNLPLEHFSAEDALVALSHDGEPLTAEHGGPARLVVPRLYAWKSAKWIAGVELAEQDRAGFWERNGYHMRGDPWREERFGGRRDAHRPSRDSRPYVTPGRCRTSRMASKTPGMNEAREYESCLSVNNWPSIPKRTS